MTDDVVWTMAESDRAATVTARFMAENGIDSYQELVQRSVEDAEWFWAEVVDFLGIPFQRPASQVVDVSDGIEWSRWFADGAVNVSEVCVDRWATVAPERPAVIVESEDGDTSEHSYADLLRLVEQAASALRELGAQPGDRIASYLPMGLDAVVVLLATARIGAIVVPIFSGFGAPAVASRLNDSEARIMVCAESYQRRGRPVDMKAVADDAAAQSTHLEHLVVVGGGEPGGDRDRSWSELLRTAPTGEGAGGSIDTPSETPFMLAYTSGTTGRPKGVVHVHGGFTVKIAQEAAFQTDIQPGDRVTWLTDMGWIMGPWITLGALANGATLVLYDGAPDHPDPGRVWRFAEGQQLTFLGLSPTLARSLGSTAPTAHDGVDLSALRAFGSTGEAWNEGPWWWLFDDVGGRRIPIVNLSGGTEVGACFLSVNLLQGLKPVSVGGPALGMDVDVIDASGQTVSDGLGELACRSPWPGMTRGVWNDPQRYLDTYWSRIPGVWVHGDWASRDADGFWYLHGRSDDTLNIAGKRIGPAEFESVAVSVPGVVAAAAVGVPDPVKGESSVLCVVAGPNPPDDLAEQVAAAVVRELGKAFKPSAVHLVDDLPRTRSAKIVRRAVKAVLLGDDPGDVSTLENPESLGALPGSPSPEEGHDR